MGTVLHHLVLLEHFTVGYASDVVFPPRRLLFLKTVRCVWCTTVKGLHNLPALARLELTGSTVQADSEWPASLREVTILNHPKFKPEIVDRIAALQSPVVLVTDWSFAHHPHKEKFFTPPYDQLSFLPHFTTLQRLVFDTTHGGTDLSLLPQIVFNYLGAMVSVRELELNSVNATDQDLQCLVYLTNLRSVTLCHVDPITSKGLLHASSLPHLAKLCITDCPSVRDY